MTWYLTIDELQQPFDLGLDSDGRSRVSFNIMATKRYSTTFIEELVKLLEDASVGTSGTNIFAASSADIPTGDGPYLLIRPTSGLFSLRTHNKTTEPAYPRPTAQIIVRARTYGAAETMANNAFIALVNVRNQNVTP
jgi:hypothetical protein